MILFKNKLRLLGFVFAFLFSFTLLMGFIYGRIPIPGENRFSDNHFYKNEVPLKGNVIYRFDCEFNDTGFFINDHFFKYPVNGHYAIICESDMIFKCRHQDKDMAFWSWFWAKNYSVFENQIDDACFLICSDSIFYRKGHKKDFDKLVKRKLGVDISKTKTPNKYEY